MINSLKIFNDSLNSSLNITEKEIIVKKIEIEFIQIQRTVINLQRYCDIKSLPIIDKKFYSIELGNSLKSHMKQIKDVTDNVTEILRDNDINLFEECNNYFNNISQNVNKLIPTMNDLYETKTSEILSVSKKKLLH